MLPEVQEFITAKAAADDVLNEWHSHSYEGKPTVRWGRTDEEYAKYQAEYEEWNKTYIEGNQAANAAHIAAMKEARSQLQAKTKDPVVRWMLKNIEGYESYIETVLPILPATREQLEELASKHEWCSEFDAFLLEATKAGVVPAADGDEPDVSELVEWIANETDEYPRNIRRKVQGMVNKIVAEALVNQAVKNATNVHESVTA